MATGKDLKLATPVAALVGNERIRVEQDDAERMVTPDQLADFAGGLRSATVILTAADLAVLDTVPFELVPAPGAGKYVSPIFVSYFFDNGGPALGGPALIGSGSGFAALIQDGVHNRSLFSSQGLPQTGNQAEAGSSYLLVNDSNPSTLTNLPVTALAVDGFLGVPGAIVTSALNAGGSGYSTGDVTIGDATLHIDTVSGGGAVLTYHVTVAGTNNAIGDAQDVTGGSGTGFRINITALDYSANPATLTVKMLYTVMDVE